MNMHLNTRLAGRRHPGAALLPALLSAVVLLAGGQANAQGSAPPFPNKPIRLVVPFAAGGGGDTLARILADKLRPRLNHSVLVDNKPGASGIIGADIVAKSPADGYTMLITTPNLVMTKFMTPKLPYDPLADLVPVAEVVQAQLWLAVSTARTDAKTLAEFVAQTKAKGEGLFYGSVGPGTTGHLLGFGFVNGSGIKAEHVAYKGGGPASLALVSGEITFAVMDYVVLKPQVDAGKVRLLATFGTKRSPLVPAAPTLSEAGYPGLDIYAWAGLFVAAGTPPAVLQRLAAESKAVMADPEVIARFLAIGYDPGTLLLGDFATLVKSDHDRWGEIIKKAGVKLD